MGLDGSLLFYGGLAGIAATLIAIIIIALLQSKDRKKLKEKLDEEYGTQREPMK